MRRKPIGLKLQYDAADSVAASQSAQQHVGCGCDEPLSLLFVDFGTLSTMFQFVFIVIMGDLKRSENICKCTGTQSEKRTNFFHMFDSIAKSLRLLL